MKLYKYILCFLFLVFIIYYLWNDCKCKNTFRIGSDCHIDDEVSPIDGGLMVNYNASCSCYNYNDKDLCEHSNHNDRCKWNYTHGLFRILRGNVGNCIDNPEVVKAEQKDQELLDLLEIKSQPFD